MEIKYPGLIAFLSAFFPLPAFSLVRYGFSFVIATKGPSYVWWSQIHSGYWILATIWAFAPALLGVTRFSYWWMIAQTRSPYWDQMLGGLSILVLVGVAFLYIIFMAASLAGRGV